MSNSQPIPWLRIFAESAAIVASILLAFAIDAWWEERSDRKEEQEVLAAIHQDFLVNQKALTHALTHHRQIVDAIELVLATETKQCSDELKNTLGVAVTHWQTFNPVNGAVESVIASGKLGLIQNRLLRAKIASWDGTVQNLAEDEVLVMRRRDSMLEHIAKISPESDCSTIVSDQSFLFLLYLRLMEEAELLEQYEPVADLLNEILSATSED